MARPLSVQVYQPTVDPDITERSVGDHLFRPVSAYGHRYGTFFYDAVADRSQHFGVARKHLGEHRVGPPGIRLHVDHQGQRRSVPVHPPAVILDAASEGIEVECLERPLGLEFCGSVPDQQLPIDEKDVRLHATEPVVKRIQQGPGMLIVVVNCPGSTAASQTPRMLGDL